MFLTQVGPEPSGRSITRGMGNKEGARCGRENCVALCSLLKGEGGRKVLSLTYSRKNNYIYLNNYIYVYI